MPTKYHFLMLQENRVTKSVDELDDIWSSEQDDSQNARTSIEKLASSSSKRKTKGNNTASGKKSRRTMSFGGVRIKPDSLQLSVVGYDDNECNVLVSNPQIKNEETSTSDKVILSIIVNCCFNQINSKFHEDKFKMNQPQMESID